MGQKTAVNVKEAAALLERMDDILIVTHRSPDGDTLGSGFALWAGLLRLGRRVRVICPNEIPKMYDYLSGVHDELYKGDESVQFSHVVSVDTATPALMGRLREKYESVVDLSIDHHGSNSFYAKSTLVEPDFASCAEVVYEVLCRLGVDIDVYIASALYTGISTDTGCYKYQNTTANSHAVTSKLIEKGIDLAFLNRVLFDTRSRAELSLERAALDTLEFFYHDKIAMMTVSDDMMRLAGATEQDISGITPLPCSVEGVEAGITLRELPNGNVKGSVRSARVVDASKVAEQFGGGGHHGAAGFECSGDLLDIKTLAVRAVIAQLQGDERLREDE